MKHATRLAIASALTLTAVAAGAADHLITFEEPGLTAMANAPGANVPLASQLHDQFLTTFGVSFSSGAGYVAVVDHGCCTSSVPNIIGGTQSSGLLDYNAPITITFFDPGHPMTLGVTDFVQIRGDFVPVPGTATMNAFDASGALLGSISDVDNDSGVDLTFAFAGIHSVVLTQTSGTIGLDNFAFDSVTPVATVSPVPEPSTLAMMLVGLGVTGSLARRRRGATVGLVPGSRR